MFKEFKEFISRGNVIDMAVGVIIGSAFTSIVSSLVKNIINPFIGIFLGKINLSTLSVKVGAASFKYGLFLNAVINFLIVAFVVFLIIKFLNKMNVKTSKTKAPTKSELYLKEIAELLKKDQNKKVD